MIAQLKNDWNEACREEIETAGMKNYQRTIGGTNANLLLPKYVLNHNSF